MAESPSPRPAILIVEDDPSIAKLLDRLVRRLAQHYESVIVHSAAEALAHMRTRPVRLVLTDFSLLEMNGMQLSAAIKAVGTDTQVALITGAPSHELAMAARAQGVDFFLTKPFTLEAIDYIIQAALGDDQAPQS
jgi:DNA-binding NtrC family response regulator